MASDRDTRRTKLLVRIWLSLILGLACLYIILFRPTDGTMTAWAGGILGTIVGYWLR